MLTIYKSQPEIIIKRGWGNAGAYFYCDLPDGNRIESAYEEALIELIKNIKS